MKDQTIAALEKENRHLRDLLKPFDFQLSNPLVDQQCLCDRLELSHVEAVSEFLARHIQPALLSDHSGDAEKMVAPQEAEPVAWQGPGEAPHSYSPDLTAGGDDCRVCGHTWAAHLTPVPAPAVPVEGTYRADGPFGDLMQSALALPVDTEGRRALLQQIAALRAHQEESGICRCGLPMTRNPHPDAGKLPTVCETGAVWECIPCTVKTRHQWSERAQIAEAALAAQPAPQVKALVDALEWYGEQSRLCRLIHSGGDAGRNALAADGGKRALAALSALSGEAQR